MARRPTHCLKTALGRRAKALRPRVVSPYDSTLIERRYSKAHRAIARELADCAVRSFPVLCPFLNLSSGAFKIIAGLFPRTRLE